MGSFSALSTAIIGLTYYIVPKLCGVRMYKENWSRSIFWLMDIFSGSGIVS